MSDQKMNGKVATIPYQIPMIKAQNKPVIAVCVSGVRSGAMQEQKRDAIDGDSY